MDLTELLLKADAPAIAALALYLWNEVRRLRGSNEHWRKRCENLQEDYVSYVEAQANRWRDLATTVREIRTSEKRSSNSSGQ